MCHQRSSGCKSWIFLQTPLVFCYSFIVSMHVYLNWSYGLLFFPLFHFSLSLVIYFFLHGENLQIYLSIIFFCFYLLFYFFISFCCTTKYQWYIYPLFFRVFSQINHYRILRRVHYANSRSLLVILYIYHCVCQFQPPNLSLPPCPISFLYMWLYFSLVNKLICIISLFLQIARISDMINLSFSDFTQ